MHPPRAAAQLALVASPLLLMLSQAPPAVSLTRDERVEQAVAYMRLKVPDAERAFGPILAEEPGHRRANFAAGMAAIDAGHKAEAERYFRKVLEQDPNDGEVLLSLGALCHEQGRLDEARSIYTKLRARRPGDARVVYNLALLALRAGQDREALGHLEAYLKMPGGKARRVAVAKTVVQLRTKLGLPVSAGKPAAGGKR
ncbi:MAG: tetratricopeptide repeat protein [Candidatus Sericytochromatia bacterium]|nr:tetratricopeptide repeat protein [Candidatus Sericytochromatia bacterium]